jgi:predicted PurR-regulated permease PerM
MADQKREPNADPLSEPLLPKRGMAGRNARWTARLILTAGIVLLALWVASGFLVSLGWAILIAIATWRFYVRFTTKMPHRLRRNVAPAMCTLLAALIVLVPLAVAVVEVGREARTVLEWASLAQTQGVEPPLWLTRIPLVSEHAQEWWRKHLGDPLKARELLGNFGSGTLAPLSRDVGALIAQRLLLALITFMALFLLYRDGPAFSKRALELAERLLGEPGPRLVTNLVTTVRGVVTGVVTLAILEGSLITVGYLVTGVPYPLLSGAITIVCAMIPLGAWIAFSTASLVLLLEGNSGPAAGMFAYGAIVMLIGDNFAQPMLVGGAARLPFLATLIGILGGLETFGLIGLFLGPVIMAAMLFVWKEWIESEPARAVTRRSG